MSKRGTIAKAHGDEIISLMKKGKSKVEITKVVNVKHPISCSGKPHSSQLVGWAMEELSRTNTQLPPWKQIREIYLALEGNLTTEEFKNLVRKEIAEVYIVG